MPEIFVTSQEPKKVINPATEAGQQEIINSLAGFDIPVYDEIQATYPTTTTEVYTYKNGGVTVGTLTVTFTNSTKDVLVSVVKS
jgi:hypothetical protein